MGSLRTRGRAALPHGLLPRLLRGASAGAPHLPVLGPTRFARSDPCSEKRVCSDPPRLRQARSLLPPDPLSTPLPLPFGALIVKMPLTCRAAHPERARGPRPSIESPRCNTWPHPGMQGAQGRPLPGIPSRLDEPSHLVLLLPVARHLRQRRSAFVASSLLLLIGGLWTGSIPQSGGKPGVIVLDDLTERVVRMTGRRPAIEVV
jgi:hypothetical protein